MKTFSIVGAMALAGIAFAGVAAAECPQEGNLGVFDYDYAQICVLESNEYSYPPYYTYTQDTPLSTYVYGYNFDGTYLYQSSYLTQYTYESCWGGCYTEEGTQFGNGLGTCAEGECAGANLYGGQYNADYFGNAYSGTYLNGGASAAGEYAYLYYGQSSYGGSCYENGAIYGSATGYVELFPYGPCTVEVPALPALPEL